MGSTRGTSRTIGRGAAIAALLTFAAACSAADDDSAATEAAATESADADAGVAAPEAAGEQPADATDGSGSAVGGVGLDLGTIGRDVAVEMRVSMTTTDLRATVGGITRAAAAQGGGVASTEVDYGDEPAADPDRPPTGYATLVVKVPPAAVDAVLSGLDRLGTVVSVGTDAQDVTDQLTDLDVQIRNAEASVDRVRQLLAEATDLRTVVEIEADLTERQTRLERLLATQRALEERVALATLTIDVRAVAPTPASPATDDGGIADAFATGWDAFLAVLFGAGFVLAVLAPFLVATAAIGAVAWLVARALRRPRPDGHDAPDVTAPDEEPETASRPG